MRLALRQVQRAEQLRHEALEDLGNELRAARERDPRDFVELLLEVHAAEVVPTVELARLAGISRARLYQILERRSGE